MAGVSRRADPAYQARAYFSSLLAFTLSLDDFVITFFTSTPGTDTFPVLVYSLVKRGVTPDINAASTILILLTVVLTAIALKLQGTKAIAGSH